MTFHLAIICCNASYEYIRTVAMDAKSCCWSKELQALLVYRSNWEGKFKMDATKKPLLIPPEFSNYAEKHDIFQIYEVRDW